MNTVAEKKSDFRVADLSLADWGRKEIQKIGRASCRERV